MFPVVWLLWIRNRPSEPWEVLAVYATRKSAEARMADEKRERRSTAELFVEIQDVWE